MLRIPGSPLQERILAALPLSPDKTIAPGEIMKRIGVIEPSNANRVAVSRALARLAERGLVTRWRPELRRRGGGYLWSRADAVPITAGERSGPLK
jgi:DNA-binding MarR family transcriptional regulator